MLLLRGVDIVKEIYYQENRNLGEFRNIYFFSPLNVYGKLLEEKLRSEPQISNNHNFRTALTTLFTY